MPKMKPTAALAASALALSLAAVAAPSHADTILFASFDTGQSNSNNFRFVNNGDDASLFTIAHASDTTAGAAATRFSFLGDPSLSDFLDLPAAFSLDATVTNTPGQFDGATFLQTAVSGDFQFVFTGTTGDYNGFHLVKNSSVLFSGTFSNAWVQGDGGVGGLAVSLSNGGSANFSSAYYDFSQFVPATEEYTFHIGGVTPDFAHSNPGDTLDSFTGHLGGDFQGQLTAVPEPMAWALMITGFGAAGAVLRRRRAAVLAA